MIKKLGISITRFIVCRVDSFNFKYFCDVKKMANGKDTKQKKDSKKAAEIEPDLDLENTRTLNKDEKCRHLEKKTGDD